MKFLLLLLPFFITINASNEEPCCLACDRPQEKYYSIDHTYNHCGEACMKPENYKWFKIFEPGLLKAETETPCAEHKYPVYRETVTHGFSVVSMTLDLYDESTMYLR